MFTRTVLALSVFLSGCAGLEIKTLNKDEVAAARLATGKSLEGYVVYEPMIVVEVSVKEVCLAGKDAEGKCKAAPAVQCAATTPFLLPDYSKPYLVTSKSGMGKAGVDVAIADGWRLGAIKDSSDNTAILGTVEKLLGIAKATPEQKSPSCSAPGLYRLDFSTGQTKLTPLQLF